MIKIYTDGSCLKNPGNGGWAAIININDEIKKISGSVKDTTNNKMELMAPIKALQEIKEQQPIKIYTDGSCLNNPGNGGWAAIINQNGEVKEISGSVKDTTNNKMELMAPIMALKQIKQNDQIEIYTDSQYVRLGITEWVHKWIKNNWQTSKKEPVKNKELWIQLYELTNQFEIKWIWVKAHAGNALNEEVDLLAKKAAELN